MKRVFSFQDVHTKKRNGDTTMEVTIIMDRFEQQFTRAQFQLDSMVMTDMIPLMPMITSTFINMTKARSAAIAGSGLVYAAAPPYGRFLYKGKVMVSPTTGSPFAEYGEKKVLVSQYQGKTNAKEDIEFTKTFHPKVSKEWFEKAKRQNKTKWIRLTKEWAGGGTNG